MGAKNIYERFVWFEGFVKERRWPNATSIARHFEISVKTAQRDIEFMRDRLNCPLLYDKSPKGYYYSDSTFSLHSIRLSPEELSSLLVAKKLLIDVGGELVGREVVSLIGRINGILDKHAMGTPAVEEAVSFQFVEYHPSDAEHFRKILDACIRKRRMSFVYYSPASDEMTLRKVDPYHLYNYMGTWHLIGFCALRRDIRNFLLGRVGDLKSLNETFTVKKGFRLHKHLASAFGIYKGKDTQEIVLRFTPKKSRWIKGQIWHRKQRSRVLKDGSIELTLPVAEFDEIKMEILKHGSGVRVVKPKWLCKDIKREARKILKNYRT